MFNKFWEEKKNLIQFIGIIIAIGSLFLTITSPENSIAKEALANIQFVWLILITLGCCFLFISFHNFTVDIEKKIGLERGINMGETISYLVILTLAYVIFNLWIYLINLYKSSFWDFFKFTNPAFVSIFGAVYFFQGRKLLAKIPEKPRYKRIVFSIFSFLILGAISGAVIILAVYGGAFPLYKWIIISASIFILLIFMALFDLLRKNPADPK